MGGFLFFLIVVAVIWFFIKKSENKQPQYTNSSHYTEDIPPTNYVFKPTDINRKIISGLLHIAKADGQVRQEELEIITNFLVRMQPEHQNTPIYYISDRIKQDIKPYTAEEYNKFVEQLDKSSLENLMTWMKSIIGTQKTNHPYEDILLKELQRAIDAADK